MGIVVVANEGARDVLLASTVEHPVPRLWQGHEGWEWAWPHVHISRRIRAVLPIWLDGAVHPEGWARAVHGLQPRLAEPMDVEEAFLAAGRICVAYGGRIVGFERIEGRLVERGSRHESPTVGQRAGMTQDAAVRIFGTDGDYALGFNDGRAGKPRFDSTLRYLEGHAEGRRERRRLGLLEIG